MANQFVYAIEGLLLGLATGPICLASCGPVYATFLMQQSRGTSQSIFTLLQMTAGRFTTYLIIGYIAGALGDKLILLKRDWFTAAAYVFFSFVLIMAAYRTKKCEEGCSVSKWSQFTEIPFILGMATGISFCPSFLLAITKAVDSGGAMGGVLLFGAFFIGTTLYFIPVTLFGIIGTSYRLRTIARIASCIVALWFFIQAGVLIFHTSPTL